MALAKYLSNKLCPLVVTEAMEVLGGKGSVEDTALPMLYREAPLNGIWEGSANVICLDALRTLAKDPAAAEALAAALDAARGLHPAYDGALRTHRDCWPGQVAEAEVRWSVESAALLLTASVLLRRGPAALAEAYAVSRLTPGRGRFFGALPAGQAGDLLDLCFPE